MSIHDLRDYLLNDFNEKDKDDLEKTGMTLAKRYREKECLFRSFYSTLVTETRCPNRQELLNCATYAWDAADVYFEALDKFREEEYR